MDFNNKKDKLMKKVKKDKTQIKIISLFLVVLVVLIFGVASYVKADYSFKELLADKVAAVVGEKLTEALGLSIESQLGGSVHNIMEDFSEGISVDGNTIINGTGSERSLFDNSTGMTEFYEVVNFTDATITPATFRLSSSNWYLVDAWLQNTGKATTTVRIGLTTSTETFLSGDNVAYLDADAGSMTLMRTLSNAFGADGATAIGETATNSKFFLSQYVGTNTLVANQKMPVYMASTTNLVVFATSTASDGLGNYGIIGSGNTFDGKLHVRGLRFP